MNTWYVIKSHTTYTGHEGRNQVSTRTDDLNQLCEPEQFGAIRLMSDACISLFLAEAQE